MSSIRKAILNDLLTAVCYMVVVAGYAYVQTWQHLSATWDVAAGLTVSVVGCWLTVRQFKAARRLRAQRTQ